MKKKLFGSMGDSIKSNAVLIILSVCVLIAGGVSYYTVSDINDKLNNQKVTQPQKPSVKEEDEAQDVQNQGENVPLNPSPSPSAKPTPSATPAPSETPKAPQEDSQTVPQGFSLPIEGEIYNPFSRDELVYNASMDDWRTHNGIDIKAPKDTTIKAGSAGVVQNVYTDGMLGTIVEIKTDDYIVRYCGLNETVSVKKGDSVAQGHAIGTLGEIPLELSEQPHLHLEVIKNGRAVDPSEIIK